MSTGPAALVLRACDRLAPAVRGWAWANLVANLGIVVTGGAVRLTGSGLGCPTWPRCTERSFTPHGALDVHSAIEFGNRTLTFVLTAIAVAAFAAAVGHHRRHGRPDLVRLALVIGLGIPAQALVGGVTVLTDLNPWVVAFHLLVSMAIIGLCVAFLFRLAHPGASAVRSPAGMLSSLVFGAAWLVLYLGTVVTGSGPHAGDVDSPRNGLDPLQVSQLHADAVFLLVGLTVAAAVVIRSRAALVLLAVELAQGLVGFVQYATDLPIVLVGLHMLGAGLTSAAVTWLWLDARHPPSESGSGVVVGAGERVEG